MKVNLKTLRKHNLKEALRTARRLRTRKRLEGDAERPRLSVFRSTKHIYAQVIDDAKGVTLVSASTVDAEVRGLLEGKNKADAAGAVGNMLGSRLKKAGIEKVVFDRNGFRYAGRVARVAEAVRESGILV